MNIHARHSGGFFMEVTTCDHVQVHRIPRQAHRNRPRIPTVQELVERLITAYTEPDQPYNWRDYSYVILIEDPDDDRTLDEIWDGCTLLSIYWQGIMLRDVFFIAIYLANNESVLVFVIPDAPWIDGELRQMIEDTLDPQPIPVISTDKEARA